MAITTLIQQNTKTFQNLKFWQTLYKEKKQGSHPLKKLDVLYNGPLIYVLLLHDICFHHYCTQHSSSLNNKHSYNLGTQVCRPLKLSLVPFHFAGNVLIISTKLNCKVKCCVVHIIFHIFRLQLFLIGLRYISKFINIQHSLLTLLEDCFCCNIM